jgi:hypothetical protein
MHCLCGNDSPSRPNALNGSLSAPTKEGWMMFGLICIGMQNLRLIVKHDADQ